MELPYMAKGKRQKARGRLTGNGNETSAYGCSLVKGIKPPLNQRFGGSQVEGIFAPVNWLTFCPLPSASCLLQCFKKPTQNRYDYDIVVTVRKLSIFANTGKVVTTLWATCSEPVRQKI